jgi:hypothetical protein
VRSATAESIRKGQQITEERTGRTKRKVKRTPLQFLGPLARCIRLSRRTVVLRDELTDPTGTELFSERFNRVFLRATENLGLEDAEGWRRQKRSASSGNKAR